MHLLAVLVTSLMASLTSAAEDVPSTNEYCQYTDQHTLCKFSGVGPSCGDTLVTRHVTSTERKLIVSEHNRLRALIASGKETRGKGGAQPPAANMREMVWDNELAALAQRHADQCVFEHDCSNCRRVARFVVGQNLFTSSSTRRQDPAEWKSAILAWYDEVELFDPDHVEPFVFSAPIGHYTQMVWANTDRVGCGFTFHRDRPWWTKLYTCNYGMGGNFINGQMYSRGKPCSQCPDNSSCSLTFPGLCTSIKTNASEQSTTTSSRPTSVPSTSASTTTSTTTETTTSVTTSTSTPVSSSTSPSTTTVPLPTDSVPTASSTSGGGETVSTTSVTSPDIFSSTTAASKEDYPVELLACDLDRTGCRVNYGGSTWKVIRSETTQGRFLGTAVASGRSTRLTFDRELSPSASQRVCVHFSYLKYPRRGSVRTNIEIRAVPTNGSRNIVRAVEGKMARSQMRQVSVLLPPVRTSFRLEFRLSVPAVAVGQTTAFALDDIRVTDTRC